MTATQRAIVLTLARMYLDLGRPRRCLLLLHPLAAVDPDDLDLCRLGLRAWLAVGRYDEANALVDRLVEHEFSSRELAFALAMQSRALAGLDRPDAARAAWAECVALCRAATLDVTEFAA